MCFDIIRRVVVLDPGRIFIIENPTSVEHWIAEGSQPLLATAHSVKPMKSKVPLPPCPIVTDTERQSAYHYRGAKLELKSIDALAIPCSANMCAGVEMYPDGALAEDCPCYGISHRQSHITGLFKLKIITPKRSFVVNNYTSKPFTCFFLKNGQFPRGITASRICSNRRARRAFKHAVEAQIHFINERGGFDVIGWYRQGKVEDKGVDQPGPGQRESKRYVPSGKLIYHISCITPTRTLSEDGERELKEMKYDVAQYLDSLNEGKDDEAGRKRKHTEE